MAVWGCWLGCNEIGDCGNEVAMSTAPIEWPLVVCGGLGGGIGVWNREENLWIKESILG